ncbi:hypothetical protein [Salinarchaeum laminariae]|uniref:hypothetical protein n=1 Tax=Salinarchaeum laminariae TaxID=869888 RepID=UPI0020BFB25E|nr:hypothetical protein [Salinarchaeum laminariae]
MGHKDSHEELENLLMERADESEILEGEIEVADEYFLIGAHDDREAVDHAVEGLNETLLTDFDYVAEPFLHPDTGEQTVRVVVESVKESEKEVATNIKNHLSEIED